MSPELSRAIQDLYQAFGDVPRPKVVVGCRCCSKPADFAALVVEPLRDLTAQEFRHYADSALLTAGSLEDFRYFLPRLLELALGAELDAEILLSKFKHGAWTSWSPKDQEAIRLFICATTASFGTSEWDQTLLDSWVCGLGQFVDDVTIHLEPLLLPRAAAATNLLRLHEANRGDLKRGTLSNAFWRGAEANRDRVVQWFGTPRASEALGFAYVRQTGHALEGDVD